MLNVAYSISTDLRESLNRIETLRHQVLLTPLPPKVEVRLRWEATASRTYLSLEGAGNSMNKSEMVKLLTNQSPKKLPSAGQEVVNYKRAQDFIVQNWLVNTRPVTFKALETLSEILYWRTDARGFIRVVRGEEGTIRQLLDYLQAQSENPVIVASLVRAYVGTLDALAGDKGRLANLAMMLFLYKAGYDCRGMLVMEEFWHEDPNAVRHITTSSKQSGNYTVWLEYAAKGTTAQLEKTILDIESLRFHTDLPSSFWELNDRQKEVLSLLEAPDSSITNRKAQKMFRISQITASRDLSKLASLGLLFTHGKGRSVYYTRV